MLLLLFMYCSTLTGNIIGAKREKERDSDKDKQRQGQQRRYKERGKKVKVVKNIN